MRSMSQDQTWQGPVSFACRPGPGLAWVILIHLSNLSQSQEWAEGGRRTSAHLCCKSHHIKRGRPCHRNLQHVTSSMPTANPEILLHTIRWSEKKSSFPLKIFWLMFQSTCWLFGSFKHYLGGLICQTRLHLLKLWFSQLLRKEIHTDPPKKKKEKETQRKSDLPSILGSKTSLYDDTYIYMCNIII